MRNRVFQLLAVTCLFFLLSSCNEDEVDKGNNRGSDSAIVINAGMNTRAVDADWESGDVIGVTMYNSTYTEMIDGVYNTRYITNDNGTLGHFEPETESETLYFPQNGDEMRLKAYYPYQNDLSASMELPWSVIDQTVLQDIDLMTAEHESGFSKTDPEVELHFYHRLSKLIFNLSIQDNDDFVDLADCQLTIRNAEKGNTYDLFNDRFLDDSLGEGDIEIPQREGEPANYRQAIVMPRPAGENYIFEFETPDGDTYIAEMSADLVLQEGTQYTFEIVFEKNPITVSATIEPWIVRDPISYESVLVSTPAGDSEGVAIGDEMQVYLQNEDATDFDLLRTFTYESANNWVPDSPVYWEDIEQDPAVFRASILAARPLNTTQLGDILIADELTVARNTGADFTLRHAASKVIVTLTSDTFTDQELNEATLILPDYLTGGYEEKGVFIPGTDRMDIVVDRTDPAAGIALFQPQTIAGTDPLIQAMIAGRPYTADEPDGFTFEAGVAYQIILTIHKEELTVSVRVVDWDTDTIELDALTIGTTVSGGEGVLDGEVLDVFTGNSTTRTLLNSYTYSAAVDSFRSPTKIYWESLESPTTFYASILRTPAYNDTQLDDYLVATPVTQTASNGVEFTMQHATARVVVQLRSPDQTFSDDELAAMTITLPDYETGGEMVNGVFIPGTTRGDVTIAKNAGTENNSGMAFIQPQTIPAGTTVITVQSATRTYKATYPDDVEFEANLSTTLIVNLSKTEITFSAVVEDWTDDTVTLTADAIQINNTLNDTQEFFEDKTIYIYKLGTPDEQWDYEYTDSGNGYEWIGPVKYWDDQVGQRLDVTAVYSPTGEPTVTGRTFPWEIAANQNEPANGYYDNYDLLTSHLYLAAPQYVNFNFTHATSKVIVNLIAGIGFDVEELVGATVVLNDYLLDGTVNLATGAISNPARAEDVTPRTDTDGETYSALVMPQTKAAGSTILTINLAD